MKKSIIILFAGVSVLLASCSDFLTEEPKLSQTTELTLSKFSGLNDATAALYARFNSVNYYGANMILYPELAGGNAINPSSLEGSGRFTTQTKWDYTENSTFPGWAYGYYIITGANNVINNLEGKVSNEVSQQDVDNVKAEALAVRALMYFNLVTTYGTAYTVNPQALGVPVVLVTGNGQPARNTVEETYARIEQDLLDAESLMSDNYTRADATDPRAVFSKTAIQALLSRVYLYMGKNQEAANYATKVINSGKYSLQSGDTYLAMFNQNMALDGDEIIFEMFGSKRNDYWDDSGWGMIAYVTNPNGYADVCASPQLMELFTNPSDVRLNLYTLVNGVDYYPLKYQGKDGSVDPKENNTPIIRLAEMYLNRAEAISKGATIQGVTAQSDLNTLLTNRGYAQADVPTATTANILVERRKELAFEGHVINDFKRTQTSITVYSKDGSSVTIPGDSKKWAFPIPRTEIENNPNIIQNEY